VPGEWWSSKLLDTLELVILLWVYKVVDMKDSRWDGTKVLSLVDVILNSNRRDEDIHTCCYWYGMSPFHFPSQKNIVNIIFSTRSSFRPQQCVSGHTCTHVYQWTRVVSERRTRWSSKLLDIFKQVIPLWVYKVVDMKYCRQGGTKVLSVVDVVLSSNRLMPSVRPLLLWLGLLCRDWM
jgi:hypothetical protein